MRLLVALIILVAAAMDGKCEESIGKEAYVVETVALPKSNSAGAPIELAGLDFFSDGRAAVSTSQGEIFVGSGLDEKPEHVTWRRFASGLHQPQGLKIVKGEIYVLERSGVTRLRDLDGNGEADLSEPLNRDVKIAGNFGGLTSDLMADSFGSFYFATAGPEKGGGFAAIAEHDGSLLRVSADGRQLDVVATGLHAPGGLGMGPQDQLTTSDAAGPWIPATRLNLVNQGGFYGAVDFAHRPQPPTEYDPPICWLPSRVDDAPGSQVWVTDDRWGPWKGHLLHLSGHGSLLGVMMEGVNIPDAPDCCAHLTQGGATRFPVPLESGMKRARFNPKDGQLYVAGPRGLQRIRYTGGQVRMPVELAVKKGGIELKFACSVDTQMAADPESWFIEEWNYVWSAAGKSPEVSTLEAEPLPAEKDEDGQPRFSKAQIDHPHHDSLPVTHVALGTDDCTVFLEIPGLKRVMQMSIKYRLRSADGGDLTGEVVNTIHGIPAED